MKNALVLGGNGFIGQHLVRELMAREWRVVVYDRAVVNRFVDWETQPQYVQGELGNRNLLREYLAGSDVVFHLAFTTIPKTSNDEPAYDVQSNVVTSVNLLTECVRAEVERVVFVSSGGTVYGIPQQLPVAEDHPTRPICSYGITKLMIEHYLGMFKYLHDLPYSIVRPSNPYGEGQNYLGQQGAIAVFLGRIAMGKPIEIWGDGSVARDYFYVGDLAQACVLAAETDIPDLVVNIGSGRGQSLCELLEIIRQTLGLEFEVRYQPGRTFDVSRLVLDIRRARQTLGWEPTVSLDSGLERTWDWIVRQTQPAFLNPKAGVQVP